MSEEREQPHILITTDSVCDLPPELVREYSVRVLPNIVRTRDGQFLDGVEISPDDLLDYMETTDDVVMSDAASEEDYLSFFRENIRGNTAILHITMGRYASKGYDNAVKAAESVPGVYVLDSGQISSGLGLVVLRAAELAREEHNMQQLRAEVSEYASRVSSTFIVRELEFMNRNGRLGSGMRKLCERMLLRPMLVMKKSRIAVGGMVYGLHEAAMRSYIRGQLHGRNDIETDTLFITYAGLDDTELGKIAETVRKYAIFRNVYYVKASSAVACNCGRGCFGLLFAYSPKEKSRTGTEHILSKRFNYALLAVFAAAMSLVLVFNFRLFYSMISGQADAIGRAQLESVSGDLEQTLYEAEILTRQIASGLELLYKENASGDEIDAYLKTNKDYNSVGSCTNVYAAGEDWYSIPDFVMPEDFDPVQRDWYKGARKKGSGSIYYTAPYLDLASGEMCFTVSELLSDGTTVVALDFNLTGLQESVSKISIAGGDALIVSGSGQIVGYADVAAVGQPISAALPQYTAVFQRILSSGESSLNFHTKISDTDSVVFYNRTANEWYLLSVVSQTALYRNNMTGIIANTAVNLCLIAGMILLYIFSIRYRRRIEQRLKYTESAVSGAVARISAPMEDIVKRSDYRLLRSSDEPEVYMERLRESSLKMKSALASLYTVDTDAGKKEQESGRIIKDVHADSDISDRTNRHACAGIIALLTVTMILCIAISTVLMINWGNTRMEKETGDYTSELESWIVEQKSVLDMFVSFISAEPEMLGDYDKCVEWLNDITVQYDDISVSYMTDPRAEHTVIMNNGWEPDDDWHVEERQWYIDSIESEKEDGFSVSAPYYDEQIGAYCVTFSKRVYDKTGNFLGVFGIDFFLDKLTGILDSSYTDEGYAFLADADGQIINHPAPEYQMSESNVVTLEQAGYLDAVLAGDTVVIKDYDGGYKAFYAVPDPTSGFTIVCAKNWNVIYGSLVSYIIVFIVIFGAGIAITGSLLHIMIVWQKRVRKTLENSAAEAEKAGQAKSQFLAQMSHEIRTPINAVLGMNEMIMRESGSDDIREYSENIQNAGRTLLTLINSILDFSKIEDGKMEIVPVSYDTALMINDLVNMVLERAEQKNLEFRTEIDRKLPKTLYGDDVRIRQIITNILTNAVKYTPKGSVTLRMLIADRNGDRITLRTEVQDTGIGIRPEDRDALFESFRRLDSEKNRAIEGTGLGISIVQKLLVMMGSELQLDSVYGEGSRFWFDIVQEVVDDEPIGDYEERLRLSRHNENSREYIYAPDARVLVVDDNMMNLKVAKGLLKRTGIKVDIVAGGSDALKAVTQNRYDIIFLDHMMPGMDGLETRKNMETAGLLGENTAVIMMTANAIVGAKEEYLSAGFDDYLSKPIEVRSLEMILKKYLPAEKIGYKTADADIRTGGASGDHVPAAAADDTAAEKPSAEVPAPDMPEESADDGNAGHINTASGMEYCMNDTGFYKEMLVTFVNESPAKRENLETALKNGDIKQYTVNIHGLKSTSKTIGAVMLPDMALRLELAGKEERFDEIQSGHAEVMNEYEAVLSAAEELIKTL